MSDSENSQESIACGHHETWDDVMDSQAKKIEKLEQEVTSLQQRLEHALWHCFVYRHSLSMIPGAYGQFKISLAEHVEKLKTEPVCSQCERDELLERIAYLEEQSRSPILGRRGIKRKKCDEEAGQEENQ